LARSGDTPTVLVAPHRPCPGPSRTRRPARSPRGRAHPTAPPAPALLLRARAASC